ncbi:hypothetical protein GmHk_05G014557 [Glycine max]|nr:hypothetical protein GmHk_05G014557 [Glycine max]
MALHIQGRVVGAEKLKVEFRTEAVNGIPVGAANCIELVVVVVEKHTLVAEEEKEMVVGGKIGEGVEEVLYKAVKVVVEVINKDKQVVRVSDGGEKGAMVNLMEVALEYVKVENVVEGDGGEGTGEGVTGGVGEGNGEGGEGVTGVVGEGNGEGVVGEGGEGVTGVVGEGNGEGVEGEGGEGVTGGVGEGNGEGGEGTNGLHLKELQSTGLEKNDLHCGGGLCAGLAGKQLSLSSNAGNARHAGGSLVKKLKE